MSEEIRALVRVIARLPYEARTVGVIMAILKDSPNLDIEHIADNFCRTITLVWLPDNMAIIC